MDWGSVLSFAGTILSLAVAGFLALKNRAAVAEKSALDARFTEVEDAIEEMLVDQRKMVDKQHATDLKIAEHEGDLKVAKSTHSKLERDVEEIKNTLVRRDEFESQMRALHEQLAGFGQQLTEILKQRRR